MKQLCAIILVFLALSLGSAAGSTDPVIAVRATAPSEPLTPGKPAILTLDLAVPGPYHINSDRPLQDFLIPTTVEFESNPEVRFGKAAFPPALVKKFAFSDSPLAVFEGTVRISVDIIPASDFRGRQLAIKGKVRYQACDEQTCLSPASQSFALTIPVSDFAGAAAGSGAIDLERGTEAVRAPQQAAGGAWNPGFLDFGSRSLLATFLLVFLGGLALNLTPCVYPMIPITISYFGGQAQGKKGSLFLHSSLYVVGMAVTYSVLGVAAAMTGGLFGAAHQYPAVRIGIALIMVLLALSMFDVYELRLPASLNRLAGTSQKGFRGTFLMGLTVGIVAAPCIGPFVLGLLTYVGNRGNAFLGFALFFVLALGLGIPFLVLGAFSGSIRRLPRSGAWMVWVRKIFGFILLAMAVFFLKTLFPSLLAYQLTLALIMLLAGIYLAWIDPVPATGRAFPFVRNAVGIVFFAVALYSCLTGLQADIGEARDRPGAGASSRAIKWLPYSHEMLSLASREGKPVFIDFYADWCAPCKELDERTYAAPEVVDLSSKFVMLKVNLTSAGDPQAEALRQKYKARGVPALVFLMPDGQEIAGLRGNGFEPKEVFLNKMNQALRLAAGTKRPM